jgi:ankyrin repeat protein
MMQPGKLLAALLILSAVLPSSFAASRSEIADAAMKGDKTAIRELLARKVDVNTPQVDGATALHWAVYKTDVEIVEALIGAGAKVDVKNREGVSPLAMASLYGHVAILDALLRAGADAKQRGPADETMLMLAARNGSPDAIKRLIAAGADLNAQESLRKTTALMWAAEQKHPAAVKALLDAAADFKIRSASAGLPRNYLAAPVNLRNIEEAEKRYQEAAASGRTYFQQLDYEESRGIRHEGRRDASARITTAQDAAADRDQAGRTQTPPPEDDTDVVVAGLVGAGGGGLTALIFAAREGDLESAKYLLDAGADVNQTSDYGWTALLTATNNRHYRLAMYLIQRGANVNLANKGEWTPLYLATDNRNIEGGDFPVPKPDIDHLEFIQFLLEHGADPNARVKDNTLTRTIFTMQWFFEAGATAFVRAAQSSDVALLKLLLSHGADPKLATGFGDTALTAAAGIGWVEGVTYEHSAKDNVETIKMLLGLGLDPNHANHDGRTPLMGAALKGRNEVIQLLVDSGAKVETRDHGNRDSDDPGSLVAGHTWIALDYADGLVRVGVQSAIARPEAASLLRKMMTERRLPVPPPNRVVDSICVVEICKERIWQ